MPKLCPNITFPHQQDFFPIRSVTKSSTARFSHENLVETFKIFVQDFVPIRTAITVVIPKFCSFCDTHKGKFLNSPIYVFFRDIYKWTLATNVKN